MQYTVTLKQVLIKDVAVEADSKEAAMKKALEYADSVIDTDDITTEVKTVRKEN